MSFLPLIIGFDEITFSKDLEKKLQRLNPMGVIFFKRNIKSLDQIRTLIQNIKNCLDNPVIAIDAEGGIVRRFSEDIFDIPAARAICWSGDIDFQRKVYQVHAEILQFLGFNFNIAPVLDLYRDDNSVLGVRAYSKIPEEIISSSEVAIEEYKKKGLLTVLKHFPGHGSTNNDTHLGNVICYKTEIELLNEDIVPFQEGFNSHSLIMPAHIHYEELDKEFPATFSKKILKSILRSHLGFKGKIVSDCLEMKSISNNFSPKQIVKNAIEAGIDILLSSFSILKSEKFISDLAAELSLVSDLQDRQLELDKQIKSKFGSVNPDLTAPKVLCPESKDGIDLHLKSIEVRKKECFFLKSRKLLIIELRGNSKLFVNDEPVLSGTAKSIISALNFFQIESNTFSEISILKDEITNLKKSFSDHQIVVISDSKIQQFPLQDDGILISLFNEAEETGFGMNIFCRGFNHVTPLAIAKIFNDLIKSNE